MPKDLQTAITAQALGYSAASLRRWSQSVGPGSGVDLKARPITAKAVEGPASFAETINAKEQLMADLGSRAQVDPEEPGSNPVVKLPNGTEIHGLPLADTRRLVQG